MVDWLVTFPLQVTADAARPAFDTALPTIQVCVCARTCACAQLHTCVRTDRNFLISRGQQLCARVGQGPAHVCGAQEAAQCLARTAGATLAGGCEGDREEHWPDPPGRQQCNLRCVQDND